MKTEGHVSSDRRVRHRAFAVGISRGMSGFRESSPQGFETRVRLPDDSLDGAVIIAEEAATLAGDAAPGSGGGEGAPAVCPGIGVPSLQACRHRAMWAFSGLGLASLLWFLVRVIPKPSRAAYPCQRAAAPLASSFVVWLLAVMASSMAWRAGRQMARRSAFWKAALCLGAAALAAVVAVVTLPETQVQAVVPESHGALGIPQGIHPGRVVWVHAPEATDWDGFGSEEHWWQSKHTDLAVVEDMVSQAIRHVAGEESDGAAWDAVFRHFNSKRGRGARGYVPGEKIAVKINLTACNARGAQVDLTTYEKKSQVMNSIDNSPQMLLALLRQLVYVAGVQPRDLSVGDPTGLFPNFMWNLLHPEFPEVRYFDNYGGAGRTRTEFSKVPFDWSHPGAVGKLQDYLPIPFAEADYIINFAVLKGHSSGITVCAKNHYGSLLRCPDGYLRGSSRHYFDMHLSLPNAEWSPGLGKYRAVVDLMGHAELGGKTLLYLVDGLFGGYYWDSHPYKWKSAPFGDGVRADWPSSLFASQDGVAIDSVAYDFLLNEWPAVVAGGVGAPGSLQGGAEDYLHEAALAQGPPSGTFYDPGKTGVRLASLGVHEHWNNPADKQYSRNLGLREGIELVAVRAGRPPAELSLRKSEDTAAISWRSSLEGFRLETTTSLAPPVFWSPATTTPVLVLGRNTVSNRMADPLRFYRLAK